MTLRPGDPIAAPAGPSVSWQGLRRLWVQPLWAHAIALFVVLVGVALLTIPGVAYTSDEGAAILQARVLGDTRGWILEVPLRSLDPEELARPVLRGDRGENGLAPYARHPLYPLVLAIGDRAGTPGMLGLSIAGTVVAALLAAWLSRKIDPGLERLTLWVTGMVSPLFFDSFLVLAHTLGAVCVGVAAIAALQARSGSGARRVGWAVAMVAACWAAAALRTEAVFLGPALFVGLVAVSALNRLRWRTNVVLGGLAVAASGVAVAVDRWVVRVIAGAPVGPIIDDPSVPFVAGRLQALVATWFAAGYSGDPVEAQAGWLAIGAFALLGLGMRWRRVPPMMTMVALAGGIVAYLITVLSAPDSLPIPGLFLAFPLLWTGAWLVGAEEVRTEGGRLASVSTVVLAVCIMLTQYPRGGGLEWGGRYFAIVLPLAVPVVLHAWARTVRARTDQPLMVRRAVAVMIGVSLMLSVQAALSVRSVHESTDILLTSIERAADRAGPGVQDRPVVLSPNRLLPQIAYRDFDRYHWMVPDPPLLPTYAQRLRDAGAQRLVFVSDNLDGEIAGLDGWQEIARTSDPSRTYQVVVLGRRDAS